MQWFDGDLRNTPLQHIGHGVNCQGVMGSGVALALKTKWPSVETEYKTYIDTLVLNMPDFNIHQDLLGTAHYVYLGEKFEPVGVEPTGKFVVNLFTQHLYGRDGKYARYSAVVDSVSQFCKDFPGRPLALPFKFASDRGGLEWTVVAEILSELEEKYGNEFHIYKL